MSEHVEGRKFLSISHRKNKKEKPVFDDFKGTGVFAEHVKMEDMMKVRVSEGRTVSLGNFEFARFSIGLEVSFDGIEKQKDAYEATKAVVDEIIEREEKGIRNEERDNREIVLDSAFTNRIFYIDYGLTVGAKKQYESNKMDVGITEPISDDADIGEEVERIQKWLGDKIVELREKLKADGSDFAV